MTLAINVIPARRVMAHRRRQRLMLWAWVCGVYAAAIAVSVIASGIARHADHSAVSGRLTAARTANDAHRAEISAMAARVSLARRMIAVHEEVARQPDFSVLLAMIATFVSDDVTLTRLDLSPVMSTPSPTTATSSKSSKSASDAAKPRETTLTAYRVDVVGLGRTLADVNAFVLRLEGSGLFDRVELLGTQREVRAGQELVSFQLRGTLGSRG